MNIKLLDTSRPKVGMPFKACPVFRDSEYIKSQLKRLGFFYPKLSLKLKLMFQTYILQSIKSNKYYVGHTHDVVKRLARHNKGMVKSTRNKGPWVLVYF